MKNGILISLFIITAIAIGYLFFRDTGEGYEAWQKKIDRHAFVADSLGKVIVVLDRRVYAKDSILLAYMQTLNKSLYELDKESRKDKATLNQNEQKQAVLLKALCENMAKLHQADFCK
jgi:hypothetical protein